METIVFDTPQLLGKEAATRAAAYLNQAIAEKGAARFLLSTGLSQFEFFNHIINEPIDWRKVEVFHLDEYVGIAENHPASFVKYIKDRLLRFITPKQAYLVDNTGNIQENIAYLTEQIRKAPIDVAMIGIGENAHVAFNDPPADFDTKESFIIVRLDEKCRQQQVGEGWFEHVGQVPEKAVTMTVFQIMQSRHILSCVPHREKARAVKKTIEMDVTNEVPATILKTHPSWTLLLDRESASLL
ncbi:MAG: glucosamine-6-phosphate deaminase [Christensenellales bacterium]|jgi:glucosamine-6-phosphate deaminase